VLEEDFDDAALTRLFNVNLFAGLRIAQAYAKALRESHARGRLLLTRSENSLSTAECSEGRAARHVRRHPTRTADRHGMAARRSARRPLRRTRAAASAVYTPLVA
jgi:hypothetical protein